MGALAYTAYRGYILNVNRKKFIYFSLPKENIINTLFPKNYINYMYVFDLKKSENSNY